MAVDLRAAAAAGGRRAPVRHVAGLVLGPGASLTLPWLASLDAAAVHAHTVGLADRLRSQIGLPQRDSAIVSLPIADAAERLQRAGIRASVRAGAVRVGFHLYNTDDDLDRLVDAWEQTGSGCEPRCGAAVIATPGR